MVRKLYSFMTGRSTASTRAPIDWSDVSPAGRVRRRRVGRLIVVRRVEPWQSADWHNTTLVDGNVAEELSKLKQPAQARTWPSWAAPT